jgi:hypothetical protein
VRPVLADRRGLRQQAGLVAVAAVAITVVAAGIGLGNRGAEPIQDASANATAPRPTVAGAVASRKPNASAPAPTEIPGLGCLPVTPGNLPAFQLRSTVGEDAARGVQGSPNWALFGPRAAEWPIPDQRSALPLDPTASAVLITDEFACARLAVAEYLGVGDVRGTPTPFAVDETNVVPPRPRIVLGSLPAGDWIIRVGVYYATGVNGNVDEVGVERFFRVITGLGPGASPLVAPAVPCVPLPADAPLPRLALVAGDDAPVPGVDVTTFAGDILHNGTLVSGAFPERLEVWVVGDACATSWRISYRDGSNGSTLNEASQDNPGEIPFFVAQNRIELSNAVFGQTVVSATVNFGRNRTAEAAWELTLVAPPPPVAEVSGPSGATIVARPGCGVGWTLSGGRSAYEACNEYPVPDGLEVLTIRSGEAVRLTVPGWRILRWYVSCGERSPDGAYQEVAGCGLGGGGDGTGDAGPARFLPFPGRLVVSIWINADRSGDTVGAQYFIEVDAGP